MRHSRRQRISNSVRDRAATDPVQLAIDRRSCNEKVRFFSKTDARNKLKKMKRLNGNSDGNVYECTVCRGFHITSMTRESVRRIRRS